MKKIVVEENEYTTTRSRGYMLTISAEKISESDLLQRLSKYTWAGQLEQGEGDSEYKHYQIFIREKNPIYWTSLKKIFPEAHIEAQKKSIEACYRYVTKEETRLKSLDHPMVVKLSDTRQSVLEDYRDQIMDGTPLGELILSQPKAGLHVKTLQMIQQEYFAKNFGMKVRADLEVEYVWGKPGVGKTSSVLKECKEAGLSTYRVTSYRHPFDNYNSAYDVLILDEYNSQFDWDYFKNLTDIYPVMLDARYYQRWATWTKIYIISNLPLTHQYPQISRKDGSWLALTRRVPKIREMISEGNFISHPSS